MGVLNFFVPDVLKGIDDMLAVMHHGRGYKIEWTKCATWRGIDVDRHLNARGIRTYHRDYGEGKNTLGVHVPAAQAAWADYVLRRAGVPLVSPALSNAQGGAPVPAWGTGVQTVGFAGLFVGRQRGKRRSRRQGGINTLAKWFK